MFFIGIALFYQVTFSQVDLGEFNLSNTTSPAFLLVEESPTFIYTPENLKALVIHALDNFGESLSVEVTPYFLLGTQSKDRTYYKYMGLKTDSEGNAKQNPFSGINTTSISLAYVDKDFLDTGFSKSTYSIGLRTTLLRFFNPKKVYNNAVGMATALSEITVPQAVLIEGEEAIQNYYASKQDDINVLLEPYQKTIKPLFRLDAAAAYSALFKTNVIDSETAKRLGAWMTAEGSLVLNEGADSNHNNYLNVLVTARYIEDGFNFMEFDPNVRDDPFFTTYYRDLGGKLEFEFGRFSLGYEYISRNGTITSERSVGTLKFMFNNDISITGGFGKDFPEDDNLITIFGINWGLNLGSNILPLNN